MAAAKGPGARGKPVRRKGKPAGRKAITEVRITDLVHTLRRIEKACRSVREVLAYLPEGKKIKLPPDVAGELDRRGHRQEPRAQNGGGMIFTKSCDIPVSETIRQ